MTHHTHITDSPNYIVLESYTRPSTLAEEPQAYQSERELERSFIADLEAQGYEYLPNLRSKDEMERNVRRQLEWLNAVSFTEGEWERFVADFLDKANESMVDRIGKIQTNHVKDFVFDDGSVKNIYLVDKTEPTRNRLQVINQFEQTGTHTNRYDVTILVNGLPLVHIELKRRGVPLREAFYQVHRYSKESFNSANSLYRYVQLFVISNGTDTRYFANTTHRNQDGYAFAMNWAQKDNKPIHDLKDFTATFFQRNVLLNVLLTYSVFNTKRNLIVMRPYQIAATERIIWKIRSAFNNRKWSSEEGGGFVWHTTGSGKTLTSFKTAQLATRLDFVDKVFFVVDRKDLDAQTIEEYNKFSPDCVNGSVDTAALRRNTEKTDNKIIVTTLQKLNNLISREEPLPVYDQRVVFIFDECHRSQFGVAQRNIRRRFKHYYQFGFTGTPIFAENSLNGHTTAEVFGEELHSYVITDAIRDEKVLRFKVDYNTLRPEFAKSEREHNDERLKELESENELLHPKRIEKIAQYVLDNFAIKTHRNAEGKGFNAMFAVSSVEAAKRYYNTFRRLQEGAEKPLNITTIFSFAANEEQSAKGDIADEQLSTAQMDLSSKEFLERVIGESKHMVKMDATNSTDIFDSYYKGVGKALKDGDIDLLIVVGMFLTGFDAWRINTLFVDKNLRYHGLIQAFSRTNRIKDATKPFGNIVTFRDLEQDTIDAITLFGNRDTRHVILVKSYDDYVKGFVDEVTQKEQRGFNTVVNELLSRFPLPQRPETDQQKREFVKLFGEYLRIENVLKNYDEYTALKALQHIDTNDAEAVRAFQQRYAIDDVRLEAMMKSRVLSERDEQDYRSIYMDMRPTFPPAPKPLPAPPSTPQPNGGDDDEEEMVFEMELLRSQEINLDYILMLLFQQNQQNNDKAHLVEEVRRVVRSSIDNRAKEELLVNFIEQTDLNDFAQKADLIEAFYPFAREEMKREAERIIREERLNDENARRYMNNSLRQGFANKNGTDLKDALPDISPLSAGYTSTKKRVLELIDRFVDRFKGIGGQL